MTSTLSILNKVTTPLKRCINEIIILIPLSDTNVVNLNGSVHNIQSGLIINNCDLYQYLNVNELIELKIPLTLFAEREASLANCYFDFDLLHNPKILYCMVTRHLCVNYSNTTIRTSDIIQIVTLLLKEAKRKLPNQYLPQVLSKHKLLTDILDYINAHLHEPIRTKKVAQQFFISQSYISILFTKIMHLHFKNYVISLKIALSLNDLLSSNQSIQSIARHYNFINLSTFTKHFKTYLQVPPKEYVQQFKKQVTICNSTLKINTIAQDYSNLHINNQQDSTTSSAYILDLNQTKENIVLPIPKTFIKVNDIATLSKLIHIQDDYFNLKQFSHPCIYIQHLKETDLTHLNVKLLLAIMPKIISKGCYLVLPITSKSVYHLLERQLLSIIDADYTYHLYFKHIKLVIHDDSLSPIQLRSLKQLINNHYPSISLGITLDGHINQSTSTVQSTVDYINNLNMDFYIINQNLNTILYKLRLTTDRVIAYETILSFLDSLGHWAKKIIYTHITTEDINLYFKSFAPVTSVKITQFLIELTQRIGGFGFPLLQEKNDDIALLNGHTSSFPIVHIYSMLQPFMGQSIQRHDLGLLLVKQNHFEILLYDAFNFTNNSATNIVLIRHKFTQRFHVFKKILKSPHLDINCSVTNSNNSDVPQLDKLLLDNFNKVSQPHAQLTIHESATPLEINLENLSIHYLNLYI